MPSRIEAMCGLASSSASSLQDGRKGFRVGRKVFPHQELSSGLLHYCAGQRRRELLQLEKGASNRT